MKYATLLQIDPSQVYTAKKHAIYRKIRDVIAY